MPRQQFQTPVTVALIAVVCALGAWSFYAFMTDDRAQQALVYYQSGEKAKTVSAREEAFNKALDIYRQLERDYPYSATNGKLYYNIANSYFQLEQYPKATLYYYKALELHPGDQDIEKNLAVTLSKLGLPPQPTPGWSDYVFGSVAIPQRWRFLAGILLLATLLTSLSFWYRAPILKISAIGASITAFLCLLSLAYSSWFLPPKVVILNAAPLFSSADKQSSLVVSQPIPPGTKLTLLKLEGDKGWVKVQLPDSTIGFVSVDRIGAI